MKLLKTWAVTLVEKDDLYIRYGCIISLEKIIISSREKTSCYTLGLV